MSLLCIDLLAFKKSFQISLDNGKLIQLMIMNVGFVIDKFIQFYSGIKT